MCTYANMGRKKSTCGIMQRSLQSKVSAEPSPTSTRASAHTGGYLAPPVFMPLSDKTLHHLKSTIYPWKHESCTLHTMCLYVFPQDCSIALNRPCSFLVDAQTPVEQVDGTEAVPHLWPQCPQLSHLVKGTGGGQEGVDLSVQCWPSLLQPGLPNMPPPPLVTIKHMLLVIIFISVCLKMFVNDSSF